MPSQLADLCLNTSPSPLLPCVAAAVGEFCSMFSIFADFNPTVFPDTTVEGQELFTGTYLDNAKFGWRHFDSPLSVTNVFA
jgi:hypothetical protein